MQFWKRIAFLVTGSLILISFLYISDTRTVHLEEEVVYMPKMKNETLRKQLGNAGWHLLHTMSVKFPKSATRAQQDEYRQFLHLFSKFYPCGECAAHFQGLLKAHPPRVSSREDVIQWTCEAHNIVNERLGKPIKNCTLIEQEWQCGCGDE
jgi:FAD-linked sulfhydryl oxidase